MRHIHEARWLEPAATPSAGGASVPKRTLHCYDIENLAGWAHQDPRIVVAQSLQALQQVPMSDLDHIIVGCHPSLAFAARTVAQGGRVTVGHGPNGGEAAILRTAGGPRFIASRYDRLVIASGDRAFASLAYEARLLGVTVTVIGRRGHISQRLLRAANRIIVLAGHMAPADQVPA